MSCSPSGRAEPTLADATLVGATLLAWGSAAVLVMTPGAFPSFFLSVLATATFAGALYRRDRLRAWQVLMLGIGLRALVAGLPPVLSDDVFRYVWDGLVQYQGLNPYAYTPAAVASVIAAPEVFGALNSPAYYSVYPPVSQVVFALAGVAYNDGGLGQALAVLKGVSIAADVGVLVLLALAVPARRALLWAASPLVVLENAAQIHTEALCALLLVGAVLAERRRQAGVGGALLAAAGWVKLVPWFLLPLLLIRRQWRAVVAALVVGGLLALPFAAPAVMANVQSSLDLYVRLFEFNAGPYYVLKRLGWVIFDMDTSKVLGPLLRLGFLATLPVLWWHARKQDWPLARLGVWIYGLFIATATTVHPWYLVPLLALLPLSGRAGWAWQALGVLSIGTYGFYQGGPYLPMVALVWATWVVLLLVEARSPLLAALMRWRARTKVRHLRPALRQLPDHRVLDLGAGEGYVGDVLAGLGARVTLTDVVRSARAPLPFVQVGPGLPFATGAFDTVLLVFVLHHAADTEGLLHEALRAGHRVVVLESVYETAG
ncbi:MAG TPA: glycosyltransferase 87 family protein, partial [Rhodothermales bacterium]|nr:glycosyltransferase 87 family protein [Rhodothermales bacterium]